MIPLEFKGAVLCLAAAVAASFPSSGSDGGSATHVRQLQAQTAQAQKLQQATKQEEAPMVQLYYLEIVTPEMDATINLLVKQHGVEFGEPQPALGNARTAKLEGGGRIAVREPMHESEEPVTRPYTQVADVEAAYAAAEAAGAQPMMAPTENPDGGRFAIYMLGGIQHGIWQPE